MDAEGDDITDFMRSSVAKIDFLDSILADIEPESAVDDSSGLTLGVTDDAEMLQLRRPADDHPDQQRRHTGRDDRRQRECEPTELRLFARSKKQVARRPGEQKRDEQKYSGDQPMLWRRRGGGRSAQ